MKWPLHSISQYPANRQEEQQCNYRKQKQAGPVVRQSIAKWFSFGKSIGSCSDQDEPANDLTCSHGIELGDRSLLQSFFEMASKYPSRTHRGSWRLMLSRAEGRKLSFSFSAGYLPQGELHVFLGIHPFTYPVESPLSNIIKGDSVIAGRSVGCLIFSIQANGILVDLLAFPDGQYIWCPSGGIVVHVPFRTIGIVLPDAPRMSPIRFYGFILHGPAIHDVLKTPNHRYGITPGLIRAPGNGGTVAFPDHWSVILDLLRSIGVRLPKWMCRGGFIFFVVGFRVVLRVCCDQSQDEKKGTNSLKCVIVHVRLID